MAICYRSNRKLMKWLNVPSFLNSSSVLFNVGSQSSQRWVEIKWFIHSGNLLGNKPFISFLPFPVFYSPTMLGTPVNKFACTESLNWDLIKGEPNLKQNLRRLWWETDVSTYSNSSSLDWRRRDFCNCYKFLSLPRSSNAEALRSKVEV